MLGTSSVAPAGLGCGSLTVRHSWWIPCHKNKSPLVAATTSPRDSLLLPGREAPPHRGPPARSLEGRPSFFHPARSPTTESYFEFFFSSQSVKQSAAFLHHTEGIEIDRQPPGNRFRPLVDKNKTTQGSDWVDIIIVGRPMRGRQGRSADPPCCRTSAAGAPRC